MCRMASLGWICLSAGLLRVSVSCNLRHHCFPDAEEECKCLPYNHSPLYGKHGQILPENTAQNKFRNCLREHKEFKVLLWPSQISIQLRTYGQQFIYLILSMEAPLHNLKDLGPRYHRTNLEVCCSPCLDK